MALVVGDVAVPAGEVADHFVAAVHADGREVVVQAGQPAAGVGVESPFHVLGDELPSPLQCVDREVHEFIYRREECCFVTTVQVAEPRAVDRDDANRTGQLGRAEKAIATLH